MSAKPSFQLWLLKVRPVVSYNVAYKFTIPAGINLFKNLNTLLVSELIVQILATFQPILFHISVIAVLNLSFNTSFQTSVSNYRYRFWFQTTVSTFSALRRSTVKLA